MTFELSVNNVSIVLVSESAGSVRACAELTSGPLASNATVNLETRDNSAIGNWGYLLLLIGFFCQRFVTIRWLGMVSTYTTITAFEDVQGYVLCHKQKPIFLGWAWPCMHGVTYF